MSIFLTLSLILGRTFTSWFCPWPSTGQATSLWGAWEEISKVTWVSCYGANGHAAVCYSPTLWVLQGATPPTYGGGKSQHLNMPACIRALWSLNCSQREIVGNQHYIVDHSINLSHIRTDTTFNRCNRAMHICNTNLLTQEGIDPDHLLSDWQMRVGIPTKPYPGKQL